MNRKTSFIYLLCFGLLFAACQNNKSTNCAEDTMLSDSLYYTPNPSGFKIARGVNLSHWLSQSFGWSPRDLFITESDIKLIDSLGFDHVRLPIDEENVWDENGNLIDSSVVDLKRCIDWCIKYNLRVVVDLHILRTHHFNSRNGEGAMRLWMDTLAQDDFINKWEQLSDILSSYPVSMLAYEPMNEPVAPEHGMWNQLVNRCVRAIRKKEQNRVVIFGSNRWQKPYTYPYLDVPKGDPNIILSVHSYHPYFFTHYKAYWSPAKYYDGAVQYPGQTITDADYSKFVDTTNQPLVARLAEEKALTVHNKAVLLDIVKPAIDKAHELGLQLYCNEFGCLPSVDRQQRLNWFADVTDNFTEQGIAYASWDYKGDFGIVKWNRQSFKNEGVDTAVARILTGQR